jgi:hypothetical protein
MPIFTCTERIPGTGECLTRDVTYEGAVIATYERNMSDDSDFYAIVWDEESQRIKTEMFATTRSWTYHNAATVDATPEILAKVHAYLVEKFTHNSIARWSEPSKGKRVKSLVRKGKAKGITGVIEAIEASRYSQWSTMAVVRVDNPESVYCGRTVWVDITKCEVIQELGEKELAEIRKNAEHMANQGARNAVQAEYFRARAGI